MKKLPGFLLVLPLIGFAACSRGPSPAPPPSSTPTPQSPVAAAKETPHPNQVTVSLGKTSPEVARLNPRVTEAYAPESVTLERTAAAPSGFPGAPEPTIESPKPGMKWVIVVVALDGTQGNELSVPLSKIRIIDGARKPHRLISFGGSQAGKFADLREYDKYKMVEPPKMMMRSASGTTQNFLFEVPAKAEGLTIELGG